MPLCFMTHGMAQRLRLSPTIATKFPKGLAGHVDRKTHLYRIHYRIDIVIGANDQAGAQAARYERYRLGDACKRDSWHA